MTEQKKQFEFSERNLELLDEMNSALTNLSQVALNLCLTKTNTEGDEIIKEVASLILSHCNKMSSERQEIVNKREFC
ncbi:MAG: hypothetical protein J6P44_02290 [Bacteroidales bacterium]|nr:hypothetical protein [Bacteroidales bacterium]